MRKMLLIVVAAALLLALSVGPAEVKAGSPCTVPASWGRLAAITSLGMNGIGYAFEAPDGTVRTINGNCANPPKTIDLIRRSAD